MIEIEYKFAVDELRQFFLRLNKIPLHLVKPRTYELSIMYDNSDGLMQSTDGRIRVRRSGNTVEFCYKKPVTRSGIKQEIEYQVKVDAFDQLVSILESMGFFPTTSYERYRTEYEIDGVKIAIDEYPFANFVEIEGDRRKIKKVALALGLDLTANLTDSCDTLFSKWRKQRRLPFIPHMKFEGYDQ